MRCKMNSNSTNYIGKMKTVYVVLWNGRGEVRSCYTWRLASERVHCSEQMSRSVAPFIIDDARTCDDHKEQSYNAIVSSWPAVHMCHVIMATFMHVRQLLGVDIPRIRRRRSYEYWQTFHSVLPVVSKKWRTEATRGWPGDGVCTF